MTIALSRRRCIVGATALAFTHTASGQQLREVTIALGSVGFGTAPVPLAQQLGLFEKHGLKAKTVVMDSGSAATTAVLSRSTDIALSGAAELVAALAHGQKLVIIANVYDGSAGTLVLAKSVADKLGVSPNAPAAARLKALDGLVIASPSSASGYTASIKGAPAGVGARVRIAYMAPPAMASALEAGAIQGYIAGAPSWAPPVIRGTGVVWISGPKHDFPPENAPASQGNLQTMADFAQANPDLMQRLAAVIADLVRAVDERPAEVKAAVAKVYPSLDPATLDLLFASESAAWKAKLLTPDDVRHDIAFVRSSGVDLPQIDSVDPAAVLLRRSA